MKQFKFYLQRFYGFAPQLKSPSDWQQWYQGQTKLHKCEKVKTTHLPASLKRRSSDSVKLALDIAFECLGQETQVDYVIFASQHGESSRIQLILQQISNRQMLSPTDFSQSVHNTASGLLSITKNITSNINSISAGEDTFFMAFFEAVVYLQLNPKTKVMIVIYDEVLPLLYERYQVVYDQQYACAFILTDTQAQNTIAMTCDVTACNNSKLRSVPPALIFMAWLYSNQQNSLTMDSVFWRFNWYKEEVLS
ncbi:beta-ketoacyl synthase chain length factor [Fastidiosibacter lacustris]|uniref:beta-ketoacyl synthase chain length factor n=1 Tax=Fastidiosibacter lacustris TaxID=2056695 RepID=UPI000E35468C|nr:beta-ketoacyl synthase chain length factor [Fastidiosibacter lacustris]